MPIRVPMKEFKDAAAFAERVEHAKEPIVVTKHRRKVPINMPVEAYKSLRQQIARANLYNIVDHMSDVEHGYVSNAHEASGTLKKTL